VQELRAVTWHGTQMAHEVTLLVVLGDLTHERCAVIVNAANSALAHGGGVAGAISRAGGPAIDRESREWIRAHGAVEPGCVAVTSAGRMRDIEHVVHAVGPLWSHAEDEDRTLSTQYDEDQVLHATVTRVLECCTELGAASVALPAISSGIFGYPVRV
jgi:putative ATPase